MMTMNKQPMSETKSQTSLFEMLQGGLQEGIEFVRGDLFLRTISWLEPAPAWTAKEIVGLRTALNMSEPVFANLLNVPTRTLRAWEKGESGPKQAALRLLQILNARRELISGLTPGTTDSLLATKPGNSSKSRLTSAKKRNRVTNPMGEKR